MGTIVAIGGGEIKDKETFPIDQYIVGLAKKARPKLLFIPTASRDNESYVEAVKRTYQDDLSCLVDSLLLVRENPTDEEIQSKISEADIIYVGGGNTRMMIKLWRERNVDTYLKMAYQSGKIMAGLSAGAICWFNRGHSDSNSFDNVDENGKWEPIITDGIGIIDRVLCPHYDEEGRKSFDQMLKGEGKLGIALDNNVAIVFKDEAYEIVKSKDHAGAYELNWSDGKLMKRELV